MSKHETSNQFKDGLMMDVHPLQTPNTVLTDCLNGTFITYNGNEYVLQNDMGNFKLSQCKLKENYLPIGTVSYGDILYIASYNPIEERFEIGSYPSPLQWDSNNGNDVQNYLRSIIDKAIEKGKTELKYSESGDFEEKIVFDKESLRLNPGDEYKLTTNYPSTYIIEDFDYYVLDDNNTQHKIDPKLNKRTYVEWDVPGYFGVKNAILSPYESHSYLNKASLGQNTVTMTVVFDMNVLNDVLCDRLDAFVKNLTFDVKCDNEKIKIELVPDSNFSILDWLSDKKQIHYTLTINVSFSPEENSKESEIPINLSITPIWNNSQFTMLYDNLTQEIGYIIGGHNESSVADNLFIFNYNSVQIDANILNADEVLKYCGPIKLPVKEDSQVWHDIDGGGIHTVEFQKIEENELYVILFNIKNTKTNDDNYIGRFIYIGDYNNMSKTGRMDLINNHYDEIRKKMITSNVLELSFEKSDSILVNNKTYNFKNLLFTEPQSENIKVKQIFKNLDNFKESVELSESSGVWNRFKIKCEYSVDKKNTILGKDYTGYIEVDGSLCDEKSIYYVPIKEVSEYTFDEKKFIWTKRDNYAANAYVDNYTNKDTEYFKERSGDLKMPLWFKDRITKQANLIETFGVSSQKSGLDHFGIEGYNPKFLVKSGGKKDIISNQTLLCVLDANDPVFIHFSPIHYNYLKNLVKPVFESNEEFWVKKYTYNIEIVDNPNQELIVDPLYARGTLFPNKDDKFAKWLCSEDVSKYNDYEVLGWIGKLSVAFDENSCLEYFKSKNGEWVKQNVKSKFEGGILSSFEKEWNSAVNNIYDKWVQYQYIYGQIKNVYDSGKIKKIPINCLYFNESVPYNFLPYILIPNGEQLIFRPNLIEENVLTGGYAKFYTTTYGVRTEVGPIKFYKYDGWSK